MISKEHYAKIQEALKAERAMQKQYLREALRIGNTAFIHQYCVGASKKYRDAIANQLVFGQCVIETTEADVRWTLRYYRRLLGRPVNG